MSLRSERNSHNDCGQRLTVSLAYLYYFGQLKVREHMHECSCGCTTWKSRKPVHAPPGYDDFRTLLVQWSSKLATSRAGNAIEEGLGQ